MSRRIAVIGGGAAGFFLAVNLKEMAPQTEVVIFERSGRVLRKVLISGGGRCNCTNTFAGVRDLSSVYPRGHRLMRRLMKGFGHEEARAWFEHRGVSLVAQADECVFPAAQDSRVIIDCFLREVRRLGVTVRLGMEVSHLEPLAQGSGWRVGAETFDFVVVTTGGQPHRTGLPWLSELGIETEPPVPSLFTFNIEDEALRGLMGTVVERSEAFIPATKFRACGPLLITHWGMSGPAVLRLSSHAARHLAEVGYRAPLSINWTGRCEQEVAATLSDIVAAHPHKLLPSQRPFDLPARLWNYLLAKSSVQHPVATKTWGTLGRKDMNRLVNLLCNDTYSISGRSTFKDEFVTCGGVALSAIHSATLESRTCPGLFFAGEVLDIDGVTGGFNFQAAWTTAYTVARAIASRCACVNDNAYE